MLELSTVRSKRSWHNSNNPDRRESLPVRLGQQFLEFVFPIEYPMR